MTLVILFVLGILVGSFLNVLGLRWNSGKGIGGRSFCVACEKQLHWWELVPVVSFVSQGGRCTGCKSRISWQYPLVELITGIGFASLFYIFGISHYFLLSVAVFSIYIVISIYDLRHKIIPDELVYAAIIISFGFRFLAGGTALDFLAGPIIFTFFALIWLLSKGRAMGFGDAKLGLSVGLLLGAAGGFSAIVLAFWIGTVVALGYMLLHKVALFKSGKKLTMKSEMPFAPFIIIGAFFSLILSLDLLHVTLF